MSATAYDAAAFHAGLVEHGLIVPSAVPGVFGRGRTFERVVRAFDAMIEALADADGAEPLAFPPVMDRAILERSGYLDSFPHLAGSVFGFFGNEREAHALGERVHRGEPWADTQAMSDVMLTPAACYPVYPTYAGEVPAAGHLTTITSWAFRREPSPEPTRMQSFRLRELVRCGTPDQVITWRDHWLVRGLALLESLGLPARSSVATDPFFGRGGKIIAAGQLEQKLKFEVLVPVISEAAPTACCSFNFHQDHFGSAFAMRTPDGAVANTACLGFGLERCAMALFQTHGFDPTGWPAAVRRTLWG